MELDDIKQIWIQYDNSLHQKNILNERLVGLMLKNKSEDSVTKMLNMEYLGEIIACAVLLLLLTNPLTGEGTALAACYFLSAALVASAALFSGYKIRHLRSIDLAANAVTDAIRKVESFRLMISIERVISIICAPILLVGMFAVMMRYIYKIDVFDNIAASLPRLLLGFIAATIGLLVVYKRFYYPTLKKLTASLKEIEQFRHDEA